MNREQEADDPFLRSLAAKEQHLILRGRHFVAKDCEELRPQSRRFVDHRKEAAASETPNLNLGHRLRRKEIAVLEGHTQDVTGMNETHDGATAVGHDPVNAHHAFQHVENVPSLVTLPEERRSSGQDLSRLALEEVFEGQGLLEGGSEGNGWTTRCGDRSLAIWRRPLVSLSRAFEPRHVTDVSSACEIVRRFVTVCDRPSGPNPDDQAQGHGCPHPGRR